MNFSARRIQNLICGTSREVIQAFCVSLLLLFCLPAFAQLNYGRIFGAITDQSGGAIVGATVTVLDVTRGISRPLTADDAGQYSAPSLLPGTYTVRAEAKGFKVAQHAGITVEVGQDLRVDLALQPGEQTQTVTVTGDLPMVNTTNASLGGTLENQSIADLPLNGRAFQKLLDYSPGMQAVPGGSTPTYTSNGVRGQNNDWMLDGVDEINMTGSSGPVVGGNGGGVDGINILSLDAIQEINIIENPKAEYGWKPGATVNVGLKSGTNNLHGTAFAFGRDGAMDARNPFLGPNQSKATDNLTQFGASVGGPIKKDKLFYFGAYERQRYTLGAPRTITEPTDADLGGGTTGIGNSIPDAIANINADIATATKFSGSTTTIALDPMSLRMAGCNPSNSNVNSTNGATVATACGVATSLFGNGTGAALLPVAFNNVGGSDNVLVKVDYHPNDHNSFNGEYFIGNGNVDNATSATQPYWLNDTHIRSQVLRAIWVWTPNSTWLNEMRFGYLKYSQLQFPSDCTQNFGQPDYAAAYGLNLGVTVPPPQCGFPTLTISGGGVSDNALGVGGGQDNSYGVWSGVDSVSYTRGKHLFKFGGEIHATRLNGNVSLANDNGTFSFGSVAAFSGASALQDFLTGVPATASLLLGNANRLIDYSRYAAFVQDDWRLTPRVTVNLGVRYENVPAMVELNNQLGNFDPSAPSGLVQQTNGHTVYKNPNDLFSPRFGMAWDVTGKGTTVVRVGGSYIYNLVTLTNLLRTPNGAQLNAIPTGFQLVEPNGSIMPSPGNIAVGTKTFTGTATNSPIPWEANTPIFNLSGPAAGLSCGNGLGSVNLTLATNPTANPANPSPCSIAGIQTNFQAAGVATWNLSFQHAFTNNLSLNVAYVGTKGLRLPGVIDLNMPAPGAKNGSGSPANQSELLRRPYTENCPVAEGGQGLGGPCFPYLGQIQQETPDLISNYNSLQMSLRERLSHGLIFSAGYTFAHTLDDNTNEVTNQVMDSLRPNLDYGNATIDARSHFTLTGTYSIPRIKAPAQLLEGWEVNVALTMLTPLPFNATDASDDISGTSEGLDRWTMAGPANGITAGGVGTVPCFGVSGSSFANAGCTTVGSLANLPALCQTTAAAEPLSPVGTGVLTTAVAPATGQTPVAQNTAMFNLSKIGCYFEGSTAIVPQAQGTFGSMTRDVLRGHAFRETDLSITKTFRVKEGITAQFRGEFFNVFNDAEYAAPSGNLSSPGTFGRSSSTPNTSSLIFGNGGPRTVQLGLKFIF